jgi:hypothetical protein
MALCAGTRQRGAPGSAQLLERTLGDQGKMRGYLLFGRVAMQRTGLTPS